MPAGLYETREYKLPYSVSKAEGQLIQGEFPHLLVHLEPTDESGRRFFAFLDSAWAQAAVELFMQKRRERPLRSGLVVLLEMEARPAEQERIGPRAVVFAGRKAGRQD